MLNKDWFKSKQEKRIEDLEKRIDQLEKNVNDLIENRRLDKMALDELRYVIQCSRKT